MSQYAVGTVNFRSVATSDVHGIGTSWLGEISAGDLFKVDVSDVIYTVASITSNSDLTLSSNYVGPAASDVGYQITRDFTPNYNFPEVHRGDYDWPTVSTQALRDIDNEMNINSDLIAVSQSDVIAIRSDLFNSIRDGLIAYNAMDTANVSDLVVGIGEILVAMSDALPYN